MNIQTIVTALRSWDGYDTQTGETLDDSEVLDLAAKLEDGTLTISEAPVPDESLVTVEMRGEDEITVRYGMWSDTAKLPQWTPQRLAQAPDAVVVRVGSTLGRLNRAVNS